MVHYEVRATEESLSELGHAPVLDQFSGAHLCLDVSVARYRAGEYGTARHRCDFGAIAPSLQRRSGGVGISLRLSSVRGASDLFDVGEARSVFARGRGRSGRASLVKH